jgi:hypothetical protein
MTLGIAIPTYSGHLQYLSELLDTIQKSTILPKKVSVSCSSQTEDIILEKNYDFELILNVTSEYKNPAQNRNIAAGYLDTDIISFIDGDDLPHFQKNEYILQSFENSQVLAVLHNYYQSNVINHGFLFSKYEELSLTVNYIDTVFPNGFTGPEVNLNYDWWIHNSHISVRKEIFEKIKYDENSEYLYREDTIYVKELVLQGYNISYISNKLCQYIK